MTFSLTVYITNIATIFEVFIIDIYKFKVLLVLFKIIVSQKF